MNFEYGKLVKKSVLSTMLFSTALLGGIELGQVDSSVHADSNPQVQLVTGSKGAGVVVSSNGQTQAAVSKSDRIAAIDDLGALNQAFGDTNDLATVKAIAHRAINDYQSKALESEDGDADSGTASSIIKMSAQSINNEIDQARSVSDVKNVTRGGLLVLTAATGSNSDNQSVSHVRSQVAASASDADVVTVAGPSAASASVVGLTASSAMLQAVSTVKSEANSDSSSDKNSNSSVTQSSRHFASVEDMESYAGQHGVDSIKGATIDVVVDALQVKNGRTTFDGGGAVQFYSNKTFPNLKNGDNVTVTLSQITEGSASHGWNDYEVEFSDLTINKPASDNSSSASSSMSSMSSSSSSNSDSNGSGATGESVAPSSNSDVDNSTSPASQANNMPNIGTSSSNPATGSYVTDTQMAGPESDDTMSSASTLPQTGKDSDREFGMMAAGLGTVGLGLGLGALRRHKEN